MKEDQTILDGSVIVSDEDPWAAILGEALTEAASRMGMDESNWSEESTQLEDGFSMNQAGKGEICRGRVLLDTYRVESDAIPGGMGEVWRVHHIGWNMELAMKRPKPDFFVTEKQKENFVHECENWIKLGLHPNIVSCYYVRELDGVPAIFSEWMENGSAQSHVKDGTLYDGTEAEIHERLLDIAIQYARGLQYAHENGLIHQDVKPDNLLLTNTWEAKVSDFGLSKAWGTLTVLEGDWTVRELDENMTQLAPSGGRTPAYCSPEQAASQPLSRRTDIYSWAVSMMELYLGRKPWAHGMELTGPMAGIVCRDYFEMARVPIPEKMKDLLAKCMEQDPDNRPHDFAVIVTTLLEIYRQKTGKEYPRPAPKAAADTADALNNRALSLLDLGKDEEAQALWAEALRLNPGHVNARFNRELHLLRTGKKYDYQVINELERVKATKEAKLSEKITAECGGEPQEFLPPEMKWPEGKSRWMIKRTSAGLDGNKDRQENEMSSTDFTLGDDNLLIGDELYIVKSHRVSLWFRRFSVDGLKLLESDELSAVRALERPVSWLRLRPDGREIAVELTDRSFCFYDVYEKKISHHCTLPPFEQEIYDLTFKYHPDGTLLVVTYKEWKKKDYHTILLDPMQPEKAVDRKMELVAMLPGRRCLLRGQVRTSREALFLAESDGSIKSVFRFERVLGEKKEFDGPMGPFLAYQYKKTGECFYLDLQFQKHPLNERLFHFRPVFYDPEQKLLYVETDRYNNCLAVWDLKTQTCRFTIRNYCNSRERFYDPGSRSFLLINIEWYKDYTTYYLAKSNPLPIPRTARTAHWRMSHVTTVHERLRAEEQAASRRKRFDELWQQGNREMALEIYRKCSTDPEFFGSADADAMQRCLNSLGEKCALLAVRRIGEVEEPPEFSYDSLCEITHCSNGRIAIDRKSYHNRPDVRVYLETGELLHAFELPEFVSYTAVRSDRLFAFTRMLDCAVYDLEGKLLQKPVLGWPPENRKKQLNWAKKHYPGFLDVDMEGKYLLYTISSDESVYGNKFCKGTYRCTLPDGEDILLSTNGIDNMERSPFSQRDVFMENGTILSPYKELVCRDGETGEELWQCDFEEFRTKCHTDHYHIFRNLERNRFLVRLWNYDAGCVWASLDPKAVRECVWKESWRYDPIFLPGGRFIINKPIWGTRWNGYQVIDLFEGKVVTKLDIPGFPDIKLRPDGLEAYFCEGKHNGGCVTVYRLYFDYHL